MGKIVISLMLQLIYICPSEAFILNSNKTNSGEHGKTLHRVEKENGEYFLWEIKGNSPSYLFGTIHVPFNIQCFEFSFQTNYA